LKKEHIFEVVDEVTGEKLSVKVAVGTYGLEIKPVGYEAMEDTSRVNLDFFKGNLSVLVYQDPTNEDFTHKIPLSKNKQGDQ